MLVLRNGIGMSSFLHIRESVAQGEPLAIVAYGIGVILHIKKLEAAYPDVINPLYDEDAGALDMYKKIDLCFNLVKNRLKKRSDRASG